MFVGVPTIGTDPPIDAAYQIAQLLACIPAIAIASIPPKESLSSLSNRAIICSALLATGALAFYTPLLTQIAILYSATMQILGGAITGYASGYAYYLWQQFFVPEGEGATGLDWDNVMDTDTENRAFRLERHSSHARKTE